MPLMTMMICLVELLRCGRGYVLLRRLWGCFRATLEFEDLPYNVMSSQCEPLVRWFISIVLKSKLDFVSLTVCISSGGLYDFVVVADLSCLVPTNVANFECPGQYLR